MLRGFSVLFLVSTTSMIARAHDDGRYAQANPELHEWVEGLKSGKGPCCSDADGSAVADVDWETKDGHYRVRIPNKIVPGNPLVWVEVPDDAVITEPNRLGRTMVWPWYSAISGVQVRCFMPGPGA